MQKTINSANIATLVENVPLSFLRSGVLTWANGNLLNRRSVGYYWPGFSNSGTSSRSLYFDDANANPRRSVNHGLGFSLRCFSLD